MTEATNLQNLEISFKPSRNSREEDPVYTVSLVSISQLIVRKWWAQFNEERNWQPRSFVTTVPE